MDCFVGTPTAAATSGKVFDMPAFDQVPSMLRLPPVANRRWILFFKKSNHVTGRWFRYGRSMNDYSY
jgi:hypothetical protein